MKLGEYQELEVARETDHGLYLTDEEHEVLLPRGQVPAGTKIGDRITVFLLTDSEDRPVATTKKPLATVGQFAKLRVVTVTSSGAFLDWGLDKDLFCAKREQQTPMREGASYVVRVYLDEVSQRVACSTRLTKFLQTEGFGFRRGEKVRVMVVARTPEQVFVILNDSIKAAVFPDEFQGALEVGEVREGYIKNVRTDDGRIAISFQAQGYRALMGERERLMEALASAGGFLPLSDKSAPEAIKERLGVSKGAYKKLIGSLYREGLIEIEEHGVRLKK